MKKLGLSLTGFAALTVLSLCQTSCESHKKVSSDFTEIPFNYDYIGDFCDGLALVENDGQWGYINENGDEVIPCVYEMAGPFSDGLAYVLPANEDKYVYIDTNGQIALRTDYEFVRSFSGGAAPVSHGQEWALIDKKGNELTEFAYTSLIPYNYEGEQIFVVQTPDNKYGILNKKGEVVLPCEYGVIDHFDQGVATLLEIGKGAKKVGLVNVEGRIVLPFAYDGIQLTGEGIVRLQSDSKYGFADLNGNVLMPCTYSEADNTFRDRRIAVYRDDNGSLKQGFVNARGIEVIPCQYDVAYELGTGALVRTGFAESRARVVKDGKFGFIDRDGNEITPFIYTDANDFHRGVAAVRRNDGWGFINLSGKEIVECDYDNVGYETIEGLNATLNDETVYFNNKGVSIEPEITERYDFVGEPSEDLIPVRHNSRWGVVDENGEIVIPCQYDNITPFVNGVAIATDGGKYYMLKKN